MTTAFYAQTELNGIEIIQSERGRQEMVEGYDAAHDDQHSEGELALAAICYAAPDRVFIRSLNEDDRVIFEDPWPWDEDEDRRRNEDGVLNGNNAIVRSLDERVQQLAKGGALIAAEIDRLLRIRREGRSYEWRPGECPHPDEKIKRRGSRRICTDCGQTV